MNRLNQSILSYSCMTRAFQCIFLHWNVHSDICNAHSYTCNVHSYTWNIHSHTWNVHSVHSNVRIYIPFAFQCIFLYSNVCINVYSYIPMYNVRMYIPHVPMEWCQNAHWNVRIYTPFAFQCTFLHTSVHSNVYSYIPIYNIRMYIPRVRMYIPK